MGIFQKSLRICAILLVGVLWSASSQAFLLDTFRVLVRLVDDAVKLEEQFAVSGIQREASSRLLIPRAAQIVLKTELPEDIYFPSIYGSSYDSSDHPWKQGNYRAGDGWQDERDEFLRELEKETAKGLGKEVVGCLGEHWRRGHPVDEHFVTNAIQKCDDKEVWSKPDVEGRGYFDKSIIDYIVTSSLLRGTNKRDAGIGSAPARGREFYYLPNSLVAIQIKSLPAFIDRDLLSPELPSLDRGKGLGFQDLISRSSVHGSVASACSHHHQGLRNSLPDASLNGGDIYPGWAAESTPGIGDLLARRDQLACSSRDSWISCASCPRQDVEEMPALLPRPALEPVLAEDK